MVVFKASRYILSGISPGPTKSVAHQLLLSHGYIHPVGNGLYSLLPLGQRVIEKLMRLIDVEMESIGAMKVAMPLLGPRGLWEKSSRWNSMGAELLRTKDRLGVEWCLQPTAEEMCTELVSHLLPLKKRMFPLLLYQTTEKFRDEMNPRFGLLRARQFLMKDLYSFDIDKEASDRTYENVCSVYDRIFRDILKLETYKVPAAPGIHGGSQSHEYHLKNPLEEDGIHFCSSCGSGSKREDGPLKCKCGDSASVGTFSTVEVAHTFQLGTKYSQAIGALNNDKSPLEMCCFGIGITRLLPAVVSSLHNGAQRISLPSVIAPFSAAVVVTKPLIHNVITELTLSSLDRVLKGGILLDDRIEDNVGKRINSLQEIGIPRIIVLGKTTQETINKTPKVEFISSQPMADPPWESKELSLSEVMQAIG
ncbi:Prolyl Amino-acyl tRNA Synthetase [Trichostrongylus colubriformis]|uniref:proline--tRNA ligase n=1 Tax=Trichostrongylus colubriformis TaxID=6319 RepID=A0AAN8FBJ9_TRICO